MLDGFELETAQVIRKPMRRWPRLQASSAAMICALSLGIAEAGGEDISPPRPSSGIGSPSTAASAADERSATGLSPMITPQLQAMVQLALEDAAKRSKRDAASLKVVLAELVTWPDGSLGCPQPGMAYTQALVAGYRIRIVAGSETLEYHGGARGRPFFCPASRITGPTTDSRI